MTDTVMSLLPLLVCLAVVAGIVLLIVLLVRSNRRKREAALAAMEEQDAYLARQWEWVQSEAAPERGNLAYVVRIKQRARRGAKADIKWVGVPGLQDAFFWNRPDMPQGVYVLVEGSVGWGPHTRNPKTFYVEYDGVLAVVPGDAPAAAQRHRIRIANRG